MTLSIPIRAPAVSVLVLRPGPEGPRPPAAAGGGEGPRPAAEGQPSEPPGGWRVLLLKRAETHLTGAWSQVSGGIEAGERAWQAALRELAEETGLEPLALYSTDICEQFYEPEAECIAIFPVFVAFVAAGAEPVLNHEHSEYVWATRAEAEALLPFAAQRHSLHHVWAEFVERPPLEYLRLPVPERGA